jgi:hypothetical protein
MFFPREADYYMGTLSGDRRLYLKPAPGGEQTDARRVVEPASTFAIASQL